jgi:hypothetical protein
MRWFDAEILICCIHLASASEALGAQHRNLHFQCFAFAAHCKVLEAFVVIRASWLVHKCLSSKRKQDQRIGKVSDRSETGIVTTIS